MNWTNEKRKLADLTPYEHNPRVLTKKGLADLKKSIGKFGLAEPIVINTTGLIIGGHGRYQVLLADGVAEVDCYVPDRELSEEECKELNVRLNKNIAGEWDFDVLVNQFEIDDLKDWGFDEKEFVVSEIDGVSEIDDLKEEFGVSELDYNNIKSTETCPLEIDDLKSELDFNNIKGTDDRQKEFKDMTVTCPHCRESFEIKV